MKRHLFPLLLLIFFSVVSYSTWFFTTALLSWGDFHASFGETSREFATLPIVWQPGSMFGSLLITLSFWPQLFIAGLLAHLTISGEIIERVIYFWPTPLLNVISMYFLSYHIFKTKVAGFTSAIVYGFNAGTLTLLLGGIVTEGMAISLLPLLMLCFMLVLEKKKMIYVLLTGLLAFIIGFYEFRILYLISWILFFYLIYYSVLESKVTKQILVKLALLLGTLGVVVVLLNFYWLVGILSVNAVAHNVIFATSLFGQQFTNIATSITIFPYFWTGGTPVGYTLNPILIHFWLIPVFAFLGLLYVGKNKNVLFFAFFALLGVFLTKQGADPLPHVYQWLFDHVPGFNAFRYATVFGIYIQFAYSILIAAFVMFVIDLSRNLRFRKILSYVILGFVVALFLWNTKPVITKEIGELSIGREFPPEYVALKNFILKDKDFYRTLSIPEIQRFTFNNYIHPVVGYSLLTPNLSSINPKLLGLESIRYIILPSDPLREIYRNTSKQLYEKFINTNTTNSTSAGASGVVFLKSFGELKLWENTNVNPHIMPANDIVYVTGDAQIKDIVDLPTSTRVSYYFENRISEQMNPAMISPRKDAMLKAATKIYSVPSCVRCDIRKQYYDYVSFPYARFLPDSFLYPLILQKEENTLKSAINYERKVGLEVVFSEKRIVEIQDMINEEINNQYIVKTIALNNVLLSDIEKYFLSTPNTLDNNSSLLEVYDYLSLERKQISDFLGKTSEPVTSLLQNMIYRLDNDIERLSGIVWVTKDNDKKLILSLPEDGLYSVYVKNDPEVNMDKSKLFMDRKDIGLGKTSGYFLKVEEMQLSKGNYPIEFIIDPVNLLATASSNMRLVSNAANTSTKIPIKTLLDPGSQYELSFDYKVEAGKTPRIFLSDATNGQESGTPVNNYIFDQKIAPPKDGQWHHFRKSFSPNPGSEQAFLNFWLSGEDDGTSSNMLIDNLSLTKVVNPVISFVKDTGEKISTPTIDFQEVNPTDYQIVVKNTKDAFFLAFSEGFDENWKMYIEKGQSAAFLGAKNQIPDMAASYFDGDVVERKYADKADMSTILGTFKEQSLPDNLHVEINGFANGWLMPSGDYVARIIYKPQRYVLIGAFITLITLIVISGGILFLGVKEVRKKREDSN